MATPEERKNELLAKLRAEDFQIRNKMRTTGMSVIEFESRMQYLDLDTEETIRAAHHKRPLCLFSYEYENFCYRQEDCAYCKAWKYIHGAEAALQVQRQTRWLYFWRVEESKEHLEELANAARHGCVFKMQIMEELMARTWHPDRFVSWCLDIEEAREWV
jgi:hypothetical protein